MIQQYHSWGYTQKTVTQVTPEASLKISYGKLQCVLITQFQALILNSVDPSTPLHTTSEA
jgi:hypothetical protein